MVRQYNGAMTEEIMIQQPGQPAEEPEEQQSGEHRSEDQQHFGGQQRPGAAGGSRSPSAPDEEQWLGAGVHIGGLITSVIVPLVLWLIHRERGGFVADQAKAALNWQLLLLPAYAVAMVMTWSHWMLAPVGGLLNTAVFIVDALFCILTAIAAYHRRPHRYPVEVSIVR